MRGSRYPESDFGRMGGTLSIISSPGHIVARIKTVCRSSAADASFGSRATVGASHSASFCRLLSQLMARQG